MKRGVVVAEILGIWEGLVREFEKDSAVLKAAGADPVLQEGSIEELKIAISVLQSTFTGTELEEEVLATS